jgi:hypothetical protein
VVKKAVVMQNEHISASPSGISAPAHPEETCAAAPVVPERPECCGTGCTVCVLDYPELFATTPTTGPEATELALLEAIERAQQQVAEFFAAPDFITGHFSLRRPLARNNVNETSICLWVRRRPCAAASDSQRIASWLFPR